MNYNKILERQAQLNNNLAITLIQAGIKEVILTSLGNSIATGYSLVRKVQPLLLRNESIKDILKKHEIDLDILHFARAQNNGDEHIYDWVVNNRKLSDINKSVQVDYGNCKTSMATPGFDKTKINEYYPTYLEDDKGLSDVILNSNDNLANIVVYNGCTGSFLDNVTRQGKVSQKLTYGLNRDIKGLEATLKFIQLNNRFNNINTQVYLCGAPNWLGIHLTDILNNKLKRVALEYANVTYVDSVTAKVFYPKMDVTDPNQVQSIFKKITNIAVDMHYDEVEYLKFNNNIIEAINDNYLIKSALINLDRQLYKLNSLVEKGEFLEENINDEIFRIVASELKRFEDPRQLQKFKNIAINYLIERFPYDFYYLQKSNIRNSLK